LRPGSLRMAWPSSQAFHPGTPTKRTAITDISTLSDTTLAVSIHVPPSVPGRYGELEPYCRKGASAGRRSQLFGTLLTVVQQVGYASQSDSVQLTRFRPHHIW